MKWKVLSVGGVILIIGGIILSGLLFDGTPVAAIADTSKEIVTEENITPTMGLKTCEEIVSEQDSVKQTIQETCELFISRCFSEHSNLEDLNLIDADSSRFQEYVRNRNYLINLRREAFSNSKKLENFKLQIYDIDIRDDCAIVLAGSRENYSYINASNYNAASAIEYLIILSNIHSGWRVYWATSNDAYSKMLEDQTNYSRVKGLVLPYCQDNGLQSDDLHQTKEYSSEVIFKQCDDFTYRNFDLIRANETKNIERELDESRDSIINDSPQATGDFSRFTMKSYQNNWALSRNPAWGDFSDLGGDCQNYVSQIIKAGGAPFDASGSYQWYYYGYENRIPSWTGVNSMQTYIQYNSGLGPNGIFVSSASTLLTGDMVHIDWDNDGSYNHAVAIYNPGTSPTVSGHTEDCINKKLSDYPGTKKYIHFTHYGD